MKKFNLIWVAYALLTVCLFWNCSDDHDNSEETKSREKPFYLINEGSPNGSVNYFDPATDLWQTGLYQAANEDYNLGVTTQMAVIHNGRFYFPYKGGYQGNGGGIIVADASTFEYQGEIKIQDTQVYGFYAIDQQRGVATTDNGAYLIQLNPLQTGKLLPQSSGKCGDARVAGNNLFIVSENGVLVYETSGLTFKKNLGEAYLGLVSTPDGSLWAGKDHHLIKIDPVNLTTETLKMPGKINFANPWGAWRPASMCASAKENSLYFVPSGAGDNVIYRYQVGDLTSLNKPFAISGNDEDYFYGALAISPATGDLIITAIENGWGEHSLKNRILFFDGKTGAEIKRFEYNDGIYYFPAFILFK